MYTPKFEFSNLKNDLGADSFVVKIGDDVTSKAELLDYLSKQLGMPDYFGKNWDALLDMLRDLSWIQQKKVIIWHECMPNLGDLDLKNYLSVLSDSLNYARKDENIKLAVVFPEEERDEIVRKMNETS